MFFKKPEKPMSKKLETLTKTKVSPKIVAGVVILVGIAGFYFIGLSALNLITSPSQQISNATAKTCLTDYDCHGIICPQVVGGDKAKCDLKTKTCYCGGVCGDTYCDSIEKRDSSCPADCNKCSDGTPYGKCSLNKPKYCENGTLINKCSLCGCLPNYLCQNDGSCQLGHCTDGTAYGSCSVTKPLYCNNGELINNCAKCGCPANLLCQADGSCKPQEAYFKFDVPPHPETFIIRLTDSIKIQKARDIISGKITDTIHVMGKIIKSPAGYNPPWTFYLDPASISFFQMAPEVCDAGISYVQQHLAEACGSFLPNCLWCPWGSRLISEVKF